MIELIKSFHIAPDAFYRLSPQRCWVEVNLFCIVIVPHDPSDPSGSVLDAPCSARLKNFRQHSEATSAASLRTNLGVVTAWAMRGELDTVDPQRVLESIFDRNWIRHSLQWLYHHRVGFAEPFTLGLSAVDEIRPGARVLVMRCAEWMAFVMCRVPGSESGDDPLIATEAA